MNNSDVGKDVLTTSCSEPDIQSSENREILNDSGSVCKNKCADKKETSYMAMESFKIKVKGSKRKIVTTGKEAVHEAIRRELERSHDITKMLVKKEGAYINVGLPSGVLVEEQGEYECMFPPGMQHNVCAKENIRSYNLECFSKGWMNEFKFFYISFEVPVSQFHGYFRKEKVRVDFFVGEGLYEALYRDGRLSHDKLRSCEIFCEEEDVIVSLRELADKYEGKHLIVKKLSRQPDTELPSSVPPQETPMSYVVADENKSLSTHISDSLAAVKKEVKVEAEAEETQSNKSLVPATAQSNPQGAAMTSSPSSGKVLIRNDADLAEFVCERLGLDVKINKNKHKEKKRLASIARFTGKFASQSYHRTYTKDMVLLMEMRESVGAICANIGGNIRLFGTCFRVGQIYILTCYHVVDDLQKANLNSKDIFVTFNFEEQPLESPYIRKCYLAPVEDPVMFADPNLDFAMLKMDYSPDLPIPITEYGCELDTRGHQLQEGEGLRLIGHPEPRDGSGNEPKQIDTFCPVQHDDLAKQQLLYIQHHGITYHVTSFFHGSSGSPGVNIERKKVVAIHSRGIPLNSVDADGTSSAYSIEQGTMISSVIEFVKKQCGAKRNIAEFFGQLPEPQIPISLLPQAMQCD